MKYIVLHNLHTSGLHVTLSTLNVLLLKINEPSLQKRFSIFYVTVIKHLFMLSYDPFVFLCELPVYILCLFMYLVVHFS